MKAQFAIQRDIITRIDEGFHFSFLKKTRVHTQIPQKKKTSTTLVSRVVDHQSNQTFPTLKKLSGSVTVNACGVN